MSSRCKKYGCRTRDIQSDGNIVCQTCTECGKKYHYNVKDKKTAAHVNRRLLIQPNQKEAWEACYGN